MLRRILASHKPYFGMIMYPSREGQAVNYGTMLEISNVQILPDGRGIVQTIGTYRFRIAKRKELDGYLIAKVDRYAAITPTSILLTFCPPGTFRY
jgi:Lon protease-like protein